jgi:hypothetical protein
VAKAAKSAAALSDRLERYWDSLRMDMIYSRELGISVVSDKPPSGSSNDICIKDALVLYHRLKGAGKTKLFFEGSERSIRYLIECVGHDKINGLEPADVGRFRDFLFNRGMSSSSVKRVFSSVRAIMNLAIKEHGLTMTNVFNGTFIPEDNKRKERLPVPNDVIRQIQGECRTLNDEPRWFQGNQSGRDRLTSQSEIKGAYHPRGLILATGEDTPNAHSLQARLVLLSIERGQINTEILSSLQSHGQRGNLTHIMSQFIKWVAKQAYDGKINMLIEDLHKRFMPLFSGQGHSRMPDNLTSLLVGLNAFIQFALETNKITTKQAERVLEMAKQCSSSLALFQANMDRDISDASRFIELIRIAVTNKRTKTKL